jgi:O-antigen ligase
MRTLETDIGFGGYVRPVSLSSAFPTRARAIARARRAGNTAADSKGRLRVVLDPLRLVLFATTVLTVSRVHQHYPFLAKLRPVLLLVIAAAAYAYLNPRYLTRTNVLTLWPMRLTAVLGIIACGSAVFGISFGSAAHFILDSYVKTIVYAFLIALSIRGVRDLYTAVWAYVVSCGILVYFSLFVFGITRASGSYVARLDHLYTYDSNDLGVVVMVGLGLNLLLLSVAGGKQRWLLLLNLVGLLATIARSGSRGAFVGLIVVAAAALVFVKSVSMMKRVSILTAAVLALAVGAPAGYWKQMGTLLQPTEDYNYTTRDGRKAVSERGLGYIRMYPWFGLGINNFGRAECSISTKLQSLNRSGPIRCTPPHNSYIQAGAELGIPGLIVWASLVIGGIVGTLRMRRGLPVSWRRGSQSHRFMYAAATFFPLALIGFAVTSFFVSFAWMDPLYLMAAYISGWRIVLRAEIEKLPAGEAMILASAFGLVRTAPGWRVKRGGDLIATMRVPAGAGH